MKQHRNLSLLGVAAGLIFAMVSAAGSAGINEHVSYSNPDVVLAEGDLGKPMYHQNRMRERQHPARATPMPRVQSVSGRTVHSGKPLHNRKKIHRPGEMAEFAVMEVQPAEGTVNRRLMHRRGDRIAH